MATIQLLLSDEANRHALASVLPDRHTVVVDDGVADVDLYLVDEASFVTYRDDLERRKQAEQPVFSPTILIRRSQTSVQVDLTDPVGSSRPLLVDEVLDAPVGKQTLVRAVANLLTRRHQTEQLQKRTEQLEELASTLRHELRNPLSILDLSLDEARNSYRTEAFERCQRAVDRMKRMLEETLLIVEEGEIDITLEDVSLSTVADECWDIVFEPDAVLDVRTDLWIRADQTRLRQLLENLCRNAVEHGGSDVTVRVGDLDDGFYVADDGVGIPDAERDRVFEEGYTTNEAGSGLGLAVVQAVADAHDWDVCVTESRAGGARFEITGVECLSNNDWR